MSNKILIGVLSLAVIGTVGWMVGQRNDSETKLSFVDESSEYASNGITVELYKSPYCGCCGSWGSYMEQKGYETETFMEENMSVIKEKYNIPAELESCHTSIIDGYVVEGHIPNEAIEKLLSERPDIKGIGMAGMPIGTPGMPGPKTEDFMIYEINHNGTKGELFMKL